MQNLGFWKICDATKLKAFFHFYILISYEKVLYSCKILPPLFLTNVYVWYNLSEPKSKDTIVTHPYPTKIKKFRAFLVFLEKSNILIQVYDSFQKALRIAINNEICRFNQN